MISQNNLTLDDYWQRSNDMIYLYGDNKNDTVKRKHMEDLKLANKAFTLKDS